MQRAKSCGKMYLPGVVLQPTIRWANTRRPRLHHFIYALRQLNSLARHGQQGKPRPQSIPGCARYDEELLIKMRFQSLDMLADARLGHI